MSKTVEDAASQDRAAPSDDDWSARRLENLSLAAKAYVPASGSEIDCIVTGLSPDGASISTALAPSIGSEIALYIDGFDRFSASVMRTSQDAVEVRFNSSPAKRQRTAERIRSLAGGSSMPASSRSKVELSPLHSVRQFKRKNGQTAKFDVIDISLSGVSLRTASRPAIGEIVTIGTVEGRVTRHFDDGIAVEFAKHAPSRLKRMR